MLSRLHALVQQIGNYLYRLGQADIERRRQRRVRAIGARRVIVPALAVLIFIVLILAI